MTARGFAIVVQYSGIHRDLSY